MPAPSFLKNFIIFHDLGTRFPPEPAAAHVIPKGVHTRTARAVYKLQIRSRWTRAIGIRLQSLLQVFANVASFFKSKKRTVCTHVKNAQPSSPVFGTD